MAKINGLCVGESLVGEGNEVAHIDLIMGPRGSAAETAFANCLTNNKDGFTSLLAVVAPLRTNNPPTYLFEINAAAVPGGFYPNFVALDRSNNVYVTDAVSGRVEKFTSNGFYLTQWGSAGSGAGQLDSPQGIALDSTGNYIYVADTGNGRIQVFVNNTNSIPPFITQQPTNQNVPPGANVTFSVSAVGTAPFAYQWNSNNVAVPGATNASFTLANVGLSAAATYAVLVSNSYGSNVSSDAVLAILPAA